MSSASGPSTLRVRRWLPILAALAGALTGYFGAWMPHRAAGLVITGVDLAEYVKFLPQVQSGEVAVLREAFYAPLLVGSLLAALLAGRRTFPAWARLLALVTSIALAFAMLPPAWSPGLLLRQEFRIQTVAIALCLFWLLLIPLTRFLPDRLVLVAVALLALPAAIWPAWSYVQILPALRALFRSDALLIGWGLVACTLGFVSAALYALVAALRGAPQAAGRPR